jgi:hypothetical protein
MPSPDDVSPALADLSRRVTELERRAKEQSSGWTTKLGLFGVLVGCLGGVIGGVATVKNLVSQMTVQAEVEVISGQELALAWDPATRNLALESALVLTNKGGRIGVVTGVTGLVERKPPLEPLRIDPQSITVTEKGSKIRLPIFVSNNAPREITINIAASPQHAFLAQRGIHRVIFEFPEEESRRSYQAIYCFVIGNITEEYLNETHALIINVNDPICQNKETTANVPL